MWRCDERATLQGVTLHFPHDSLVIGVGKGWMDGWMEV